MDLTAVIPALDESKLIGGVVRGFLETAGGLGINCEAVVVDGGSQDDTPAAARRAGARVVETSGGFAAALRAGIEASAGDYVLIMDGDGSHPIERFPEFWKRRHEADVVIGSRLIQGGGAELPGYRFCLTRALNAFFQKIVGLPAADSSSGYRLYRGAALRGLGGVARGFEFQQETLLQIVRAGGRVIELPIHYEWRKEGESKARVIPLALGYLRVFARYGISGG